MGKFVEYGLKPLGPRLSEGAFTTGMLPNDASERGSKEKD